MNRQTPGAKHRGSSIVGVATNVALLLVVVFFGAPFLWILGLAFDAAAIDRVPWPRQPTLDNFRVLFDAQQARSALRNSLIVATSCMVTGTILAALAGFGLSRIQFRRKNELVYAVLLLYVMPLAVTMVAVNDLANRLDLINTYRGLVFAQTAIMLPFLTWLMKGFYDAVPRHLDEAAWLDGGSILRGWWEILTPVALLGVVITAGLAFVIAWSDVLLMVILVTDPGMATLSQQFFTTAEQTGGATTAALGVLYIAPVLVVFLLLRQVMLRSLSEGRAR
ncbi:carbohydrate ABC transporter permease [soil metagenome]